jgi:hypothetical protein
MINYPFKIINLAKLTQCAIGTVMVADNGPLYAYVDIP